MMVRRYLSCRSAKRVSQSNSRAGPVRGVHLHPTRPLLVSGGDDCKVKVWGQFLLAPGDIF
jgi:hypothetical protein